MERAVEELRKLLSEASAEYGALERAKAKADEENAESLLQSTTLVKELKDELDNVNQLLQASAKRSEYDERFGVSINRLTQYRQSILMSYLGKGGV